MEKELLLRIVKAMALMKVNQDVFGEILDCLVFLRYETAKDSFYKDNEMYSIFLLIGDLDIPEKYKETLTRGITALSAYIHYSKQAVMGWSYIREHQRKIFFGLACERLAFRETLTDKQIGDFELFSTELSKITVYFKGSEIGHIEYYWSNMTHQKEFEIAPIVSQLKAKAELRLEQEGIPTWQQLNELF